MGGKYMGTVQPNGERKQGEKLSGLAGSRMECLAFYSPPLPAVHVTLTALPLSPSPPFRTTAECSRMCLPRGRCTLPNPLLLLLPSQLSAFERTYQGAAAREMDSLLDVQKQLSERRAALQAVVGGGEGVGEGGGDYGQWRGWSPPGPGGR